MSVTQEIDAKKRSIRDIFQDFWFVIPEYQRAYVWSSDQVNELMDDLWFAYENKSDSEYFLGSIVLKSLANQEFAEYEVLDGQQRLTTFYLLMGVIRDNVSVDKLKDVCSKHIFQEEDPYAGVPTRSRIIYKIRGDIDDFVNQYLKKEGGTQQVTGLEDLKRDSKHLSIKNMANTLLVLSKFFASKSEQEIDHFAQFLFKRAVFIYVSTENREDAFRMFTILNNRGLPLTSSDILKSINIGKITNQYESRQYAQDWESMEGELDEEFDRFLSFIRHTLVKDKARSNLLDEFEEKIYNKELLEKGKETIEYIKKYKSHYDKLLNFENSKITNKHKNLVTIMLIGLPSRDWVSPLLYFFDKYGHKNLTDFLERLEAKFSYDWIMQLTPTQRIENMSKVLKAIDRSTTPEEVIDDPNLFKIDKAFIRQVLNGNIYGRRFARYILLKYEFLKSDHTVHLSDYKTISVEHILPQKPDANSRWVKSFSEVEREEWLHKLGNLTLISMRKNTELTNLDFKEKKERYLSKRIDVFAGSKVFIQKSDEWTVESIRKRQEEMLETLIKEGF